MNTTDKGLPDQHASTLRTMIHSRQDGEVCVCAECRAIAYAIDALSAASGKAVGYVDGSRLHELQEGRLNLALWADSSYNGSTPLYLHPATVTNEVSPPLKVSDEGVTQIIRLARRHEGHDPQLRAALSSFVRPTPPASTKGG